jgi:hypothetical protein
MPRLSVFAAAAVLSALTATPVAFAKERHHVRNAPEFAGEQVRNAHAAITALPGRPSGYLAGTASMYTGGWSAPAGR